MNRGIVTLVSLKFGVYDDIDYLIAFLNSIDIHAGKEIPVSLLVSFYFPIKKFAQEVIEEISSTRKNVKVSFIEDPCVFYEWDDCLQRFIDASAAPKKLPAKLAHRALCAFEQPFEEFLYLDSSSLLLGPIDSYFSELDTQSVFLPQVEAGGQQHWWECFAAKGGQVNRYIKPNSSLRTNIDKPDFLPSVSLEQFLEQCGIGSRQENPSALWRPYTSKNLRIIENKLVENQEQISVVSFLPFSLNRRPPLRKVCEGANIDFPLRDLLLHYRYAHEPDKYPSFSGQKRGFYPVVSKLKEDIPKKIPLILKVREKAYRITRALNKSGQTNRLTVAQMNFNANNNTKEIRFLGMRRSGNHAIINWLLNHEKGVSHFLNNLKMESELYRKRTVKGVSALEIGSDTDLLVLSYEDYFVEEIFNRRLEMQRQEFFGKSSTVQNVLILRDPFNCFASRIKSDFFYVRDIPGRKQVLDLWKSYAREFLGISNTLGPGGLVISYNHWASDADYRKDVIGKLGYDSLNDQILSEVPKYGGGSSFDSLKLDGKAEEMKVFDRWHIYKDRPFFVELFADEELRDLVNKIYGDIPIGI
ncbi:MAG: hypothetical protein K2W82_00045 [Candidatus Obscuribacterales bacterium]|nr:hypothetical protein [Candidatus Obscuribacterales bacterium]